MTFTPKIRNPFLAKVTINERRLHKRYGTGGTKSRRMGGEIFPNPIAILPSLQPCGLSPLNYLEHVLIEERESIHDPLVKPMQVRGIHLDQGSNEGTGSMGPMFVVAVHPSQWAAHISPVNQPMIFHAFEDVAGRFKSVAEPLNGRE